MKKLNLKADTREVVGRKTRALRREGYIPAVIYGKGEKSKNLKVNKKEFDRVYKKTGGSSIVELEIKGEGKKNVIINMVQRDPVNDEAIHADFHKIRMDQKITAAIPLRFIGDSEAVISLGGSLLTPKDEIEVECLPNDLPHEIEVDISPLETFESVIHVSDLNIPEEVEVKDDTEETVAFVEPPRSEEEMAELEEAPEEEEMPESEHGEEEVAEGEEGEESKEETEEEQPKEEKTEEPEEN